MPPEHLQDEDLVRHALAARKAAWSPYSSFSVGAALVDERGVLHTGCNVENASYPEGCCAETSAIAAMVLGGGRRIRTLVVAGGHDTVRACTPCGGCRQRIAEFADDDTRVLCLTGNDSWEEWTVADLLPASFRLEP